MLVATYYSLDGPIDVLRIAEGHYETNDYGNVNVPSWFHFPTYEEVLKAYKYEAA